MKRKAFTKEHGDSKEPREKVQPASGEKRDAKRRKGRTNEFARNPQAVFWITALSYSIE